jgi:hypothetical protein
MPHLLLKSIQVKIDFSFVVERSLTSSKSTLLLIEMSNTVNIVSHLGSPVLGCLP